MLRFPWAKYCISKLLLIFDYNMDRCDCSECTKVKLKAKCSYRVKKRQVQVLVYSWLGNAFYISTTLFAAPIFFHKFQLCNFTKPHPCFKIHLVILIAVFLGNKLHRKQFQQNLEFLFLGGKKKQHTHKRSPQVHLVICHGVLWSHKHPAAEGQGFPFAFLSFVQSGADSCWVFLTWLPAFPFQLNALPYSPIPANFHQKKLKIHKLCIMNW